MRRNSRTFKVLVELFDKVQTTPNILTELSNLGNMELGEPFLEKLKLFVESADEANRQRAGPKAVREISSFFR